MKSEILNKILIFINNNYNNYNNNNNNDNNNSQLIIQLVIYKLFHKKCYNHHNQIKLYRINLLFTIICRTINNFQV